jgi:hypothetical protein
MNDSQAPNQGETDAKTNLNGSHSVAVPRSQWVASRSALAIAFLVGFLWWLLLFSPVMDYITVPSEIKMMLGLFVPILTIFPILYRTCLYRGMRRGTRMCMLFLISAGLFIASIGLWALGMLILIAFGGVSPD